MSDQEIKLSPSFGSQLAAQRITGADLAHASEALMLKKDTKLVLIWVRSYRPFAGDPLVHEYDAYAHNAVGQFIHFPVTDADLVSGTQRQAQGIEAI